MRNTVFCLSREADTAEIVRSVERMAEEVRTYVPGYQLKQQVQFEAAGKARPLRIPGLGEYTGIKTSIFLEIEGSGHYLPPYAGNLDIMTSAALKTAERLAQRQTNGGSGNGHHQ
jgi:acetaldehyde dehydrogenase